MSPNTAFKASQACQLFSKSQELENENGMAGTSSSLVKETREWTCDIMTKPHKNHDSKLL
jgi:hypothetical protein